MARKNYEKPTPSHPLAIPTEEEFLIWCESPVTQFVALAYKISAEAQRETWIDDSWNNGKASVEELIMLRTREDAYAAFLQCGYEEYLAIVKRVSPLK